MHLADQILSAKVYLPAAAAAVAGLSFCAARIRRPEPEGERQQGGGFAFGTSGEHSIPLMGVMGAFVFAAQMVNFPILPGTSGHLGGGVLLAILFGPYHAAILMASILTVQCLVFQDGGLLALGANVLTMGIVPCFLGYAVFQALAFSARVGRNAAAFCAALAGVLAGALLVPFLVVFSGVAALPLGGFLAVMLGIHAAIGAVEGVITVAVLRFIARVYPSRDIGTRRMSRPAIAGLLLVLALVVGGGLSTFASEAPDGLEKAVEVSAAAPLPPEGEPLVKAPLPDYAVPGMEGAVSAALAGITGTLGCFLVVLLLSRFAGRPR